MDWVKYLQAKTIEEKMDAIKDLKENFFSDEHQTFENVRLLLTRPEWKDFLNTLNENLQKEFQEL